MLTTQLKGWQTIHQMYIKNDLFTYSVSVLRLLYIFQVFILLHWKFLQFDWLRAVVFQLNLKYLRVKINPSPEFSLCCSILKRFYLWWKAFDLFNKLGYILWVVALPEACDVTNNGRHLRFY